MVIGYEKSLFQAKQATAAAVLAEISQQWSCPVEYPYVAKEWPYTSGIYQPSLSMPPLTEARILSYAYQTKSFDIG